jgi:UDP-glucose 4-epimerase
MVRRILVSGGNGFLGGYVVKELLKNPEARITILTHKKRRLEDLNERVSYIPADIREEKELMEKVKDFDIVYHLAGNTRTKFTDTASLHQSINAQGTLNLLKACSQNNVSRFIFISTCEVYGDKSREGIAEDEKKEPSNDYAKSKVLAEEYCKKYSDNIQITVIRPSYIYGYGQPEERLFPRLIKSALQDQKIELSPNSGGYDFVYVKDVATGIVSLGEKQQQEKFEDYNLSSGKFSSLEEVFDIVGRLTGKEYLEMKSLSSGEKKFSLSIEKAMKQGYLPKYTLEEGLADSIKYFQESLDKNLKTRSNIYSDGEKKN